MPNNKCAECGGVREFSAQGHYLDVEPLTKKCAGCDGTGDGDVQAKVEKTEGVIAQLKGKFKFEPIANMVDQHDLNVLEFMLQEAGERYCGVRAEMFIRYGVEL